MLLSRHQNVAQNRDIKIANRLFENVSQFKYLGTTVTNQNLIQEKNDIIRQFYLFQNKEGKLTILETEQENRLYELRSLLH
jgi:hypothetical protein